MLDITACTYVATRHWKVGQKLKFGTTGQLMSILQLLMVTPLMQGGMQQWGTLLSDLQVPHLASFTGFNDNWKTLLTLLSDKTKQMLGSECIMFVSGPGTWTCKTNPEKKWPLMLKLVQKFLTLRSTMQIMIKMHGLQAVFLQ